MPKFEEEIFPTQLGQVAVTRWGQGSPTVVLVPGFTLNRCDWPRKFLRTLTREGYGVAAIDLPDSGASERLERGYSVADLALALSEVAQSLAPPLHWVGLSLGSLILQSLPWGQVSVGSLTFLMTSAGSTQDGLGDLQTMVKLLSIDLQQPPDTLTYEVLTLREKLAGKVNESDLAELRLRVAASVQRGWPYGRGPVRQLRAVSDFYRVGSRPPEQGVGPTLVLHGQNDPLLPLAGARRLASIWPGCRMVELEGLGHELMKTKLDRVLDPLLRLLQTGR